MPDLWKLWKFQSLQKQVEKDVIVIPEAPSQTPLETTLQETVEECKVPEEKVEQEEGDKPKEFCKPEKTKRRKRKK